jgi:large subunit ribosomal protein L18
MLKPTNRGVRRQLVKKRIRRKVSGTKERPRLAVFRSRKHFYVQAVDDTTSRTLCSASTVDSELKSSLGYGGNVAAASAVGELIARRLKECGVESAVFDRGGYKYHGRVKAAGEAARKSGLKL